MAISTQSQNRTVAERIAASLKRHQVTLCFGQSLPSALILACEDLGIRQIVYRTENAGGAMADGFARRSGKIGVVTAQNGPAASLLVAPLAEALKASVPMIALVQDVNRNQIDRNAFQEFDHLALFKSCTKWVRQINDAGRVEEYVDQAFTIAASGRPGPVALMLPADLLIEKTDPAPFPRSQSLGTWPIDRQAADPDTVGIAAQMIAKASSPLVVAGGGVHSSQAVQELVALQDTYGLAVAYTTMGKGVVDDRHPLSLGLVGNIMGKYSLGHYTRPIVDAADLILLVGTRTNQNGTDSWSLFPDNAKIIHLDIASEEIGRNYESLRLAGDARLTLRALHKVLATKALGEQHSRRSAREKQISDAKSRHLATTQALRTQATPSIRPEYLMNALQKALTPETTMVADASYSSIWITSCLEALEAGQRFLTPRGLAGLGWGYPMALGAKLAAPENPVVCVVGDGGFGHCWSELETAKRMNIPVTVIVLNNGVLGYQKDAENVKFGRYTTACHFAPVNHAEIARACGVRAHRIVDPKDLEKHLPAAITTDEPLLVEIMTDPMAYPPITFFDGALDY